MHLPLSLEESIIAAREAVRRDQQHHLNPGYRHAIYVAFGPRVTDARAVPNFGLRRRVRLDVLATRRVLSKWEELRPHDDLPRRLLQAAEDVVNGRVIREVAQEFYDRSWEDLEALARDPNYQNGYYQDRISAGLSAACTLAAALHDETFDSNRIDYALKDTDTDVFSKDAAFWASTSYAGPIWDGSSDDSKRREFWEWWLGEAVSEAWSGTSE